jgi:hypothetical protein
MAYIPVAPRCLAVLVAEHQLVVLVALAEERLRLELGCPVLVQDLDRFGVDELDLLVWVTPPEAMAMIVTSLYAPVRDHLERLT